MNDMGTTSVIMGQRVVNRRNAIKIKTARGREGGQWARKGRKRRGGWERERRAKGGEVGRTRAKFLKDTVNEESKADRTDRQNDLRHIKSHGLQFHNLHK